MAEVRKTCGFALRGISARWERKKKIKNKKNTERKDSHEIQVEWSQICILSSQKSGCLLGCSRKTWIHFPASLTHGAFNGSERNKAPYSFGPDRLIENVPQRSRWFFCLSLQCLLCCTQSYKTLTIFKSHQNIITAKPQTITYGRKALNLSFIFLFFFSVSIFLTLCCRKTFTPWKQNTNWFTTIYSRTLYIYSF